MKHRLLGIFLAALAGIPDVTAIAHASASAVSPLSCDLSVDRLHAAYQSGALDVEQTVQWYVQRIGLYDRTGPRLEAVAFPDIDRALANARAMDDLPASERKKLPLFGVPIVVKDMIDVAGLPTALGTRLLGTAPARRDAPTIARLKAAGAIIVGKSTMTGDSKPFLPGYSAQGLTINPFDPDRDPQGSSTGSAVSVAAGLSMIGIGEETTDSLRGVADAVGIVSLRATRGRVPMDGVYPLSRNLDVVGPLATHVADAALVMDVLTDCRSGGTSCVSVARKPMKLTGVRLGVPKTYAGRNQDFHAVPFSDRTLAAFGKALSELEALGAVIVLVDRPSVGPYDYLSRSSDADYAGIDIPDWRDKPFRIQDNQQLASAIDRYFRDYGSGAYAGLEKVIEGMQPAANAAGSDGAGDVLTAHSLKTISLSSKDATSRDLLEKFDAAREVLYQRDMVQTARKFRLDGFVFPTAFRPPLSVIEGMRDSKFSGDDVFASAPIDFGVPAVTVPMPPIAADLPATLTFMGLRDDDAHVVAIADAYERATRHHFPPATFCGAGGAQK